MIARERNQAIDHATIFLRRRPRNLVPSRLSRQVFRSVDEARDMAETVSYDLACSEKDECMGSEIQVRDALGRFLCAIPVRAAEAVFA